MKTKQTILTITLLMAVLFNYAQDKYEFMIIEYDKSLKNEIQISIDGKTYLEEKANFTSEENSKHNSNPFLKKVNEYQDNGWELMNFNSVLNTVNYEVHFAYMRKKKTIQK